jgi:hypothetical protein
MTGFYYFVVGEAVDKEPPDYMGIDGECVPHGGDFALVRKFFTRLEARNFYHGMARRYGVQTLHMRWYSSDGSAPEGACRNKRWTPSRYQ